ncbi:MAG: MazG-like family protein [Candidatus Diapherotrites archaeon]
MNPVQERVRAFCEAHNLRAPPEHHVLDTMSELGEVAKEILKSSDYGKTHAHYSEKLKEEVGDFYFTLLRLANIYNVDLDEALEMVLQKYEKRLDKGGAGSENE